MAMSKETLFTVAKVLFVSIFIYAAYLKITEDQTHLSFVNKRYGKFWEWTKRVGIPMSDKFRPGVMSAQMKTIFKIEGAWIFAGSILLLSGVRYGGYMLALPSLMGALTIMNPLIFRDKLEAWKNGEDFLLQVILFAIGMMMAALPAELTESNTRFSEKSKRKQRATKEQKEVSNSQKAQESSPLQEKKQKKAKAKKD